MDKVIELGITDAQLDERVGKEFGIEPRVSWGITENDGKSWMTTYGKESEAERDLQYLHAYEALRGIKIKRIEDFPRFTADLNLAFELVAKVPEYSFSLFRGDKEWTAYLGCGGTVRGHGAHKSAPRAIVLAGMKVRGWKFQEVEE